MYLLDDLLYKLFPPPSSLLKVVAASLYIMTAVLTHIPNTQIPNRSSWVNNNSAGMQAKMSDDNPRRNNSMLAPRKSAQRSNSSSSISSISSSSSSASTSSVASNATATHSNFQIPADGITSWGQTSAFTRKKAARNGLYPTAKAEAVSAVSTARPQSILANNGPSAVSTMVLPSQHLQNPNQQSNVRAGAPAVPDANPVVLCLLSMNGTFDRKNINVPYYPDCVRIGRQTNAKTVPTATNGFFDSKVLSRQHAEIWADRQGKVYIRDIKSSNGTFVNGTRLSPENRDSLPHEIQAQDNLELGIDIVSEDQKTVVHHKVAAKVEHAGWLTSNPNVLDMSFGDLDPANGIGPSQGDMQLRGRSTSQGSAGSNGRFQGNAGTNMNLHRPMNFWLTPVTTEHIVKRLAHEMKIAKLQTNDLSRTGEFFDTLLSKSDLKDFNKVNTSDGSKQPYMNGSLSSKSRFSDPPAPPPSQPLPEKPDMARSHAHPSDSPSLKRSTTERPRSFTNGSPVRQEQTSQVLTLVEALASARKEIDIQGARMRDLECMLQREREARETAEELAKRLEQESAESRANGLTFAGNNSENAPSGTSGSTLEDAFDPPIEALEDEVSESIGVAVTKDSVPTIEETEASTSLLQQRLNFLVVEMNEMKQHMEAYKRRAENAEAERDAERLSLAEMIQKARETEEETHRQSTRRDRSRSGTVTSRSHSSADVDGSDGKSSSLAPALQPTLEKNSLSSDSETPTTTLLAGSPPCPGATGSKDQLVYQAAPYASILGVVGLGLILMTYLNGWQKAEP